MGFLRALSFFTVIPTKTNREDFNDGGRNFWWTVGMLIGIADGAFFVSIYKLFGAFVSVSLTLLFDGLLTQFLHYDGLGDAADALLGSKTKEDRLKILKDPNIGVFGLCVVIMSVFIRFAILRQYLVFKSVNYIEFILLFGSIGLLARSLVYIIGSRNHVIEGSFLGQSVFKIKMNIVETIGQLGVCCLALFTAGYAFYNCFGYQYPNRVDSLSVFLYVGSLTLAMAMVIFGIYKLASKRLGGINGDIMGAAIMLSETAGLLVGVAKW